MPKRKLTKHEDDIRRGLRSPDSTPPYGKLRKSAEINPAQSPHDGIHTCSKGCSKPGCNRALRDTIEEQDKQIEALKRDVLEAAAYGRKLDDFMQRFDWILFAHYCKGGANETHAKLDALRAEYLEWKNPGEGKVL
jgi:hypothetical protein